MHDFGSRADPDREVAKYLEQFGVAVLLLRADERPLLVERDLSGLGEKRDQLVARLDWCDIGFPFSARIGRHYSDDPPPSFVASQTPSNPAATEPNT